ncbi:hypothetical protein JOL79_07000 [Microbispora sp. RL4-1S]|uniref:Uncharacterized protein n=1 Tax=Microbispora oryzae TaxID=2806554 RepID=A0A940WDP5_9ACTN|nr:hypothetical protein [Microbispora oryzae]MBP2703546.1 hypothetical protein [Microbispora oryzae]
MSRSRRRRRPQICSADFWLRALDDAITHGASAALAGLGAGALDVIPIGQARQVLLLGAGGALASLLGSLARTRRGAGVPSRGTGPSAAAVLPVERNTAREQ